MRSRLGDQFANRLRARRRFDPRQLLHAERVGHRVRVRADAADAFEQIQDSAPSCAPRRASRCRDARSPGGSMARRHRLAIDRESRKCPGSFSAGCCGPIGTMNFLRACVCESMLSSGPDPSGALVDPSAARIGHARCLTAPFRFRNHLRNGRHRRWASRRAAASRSVIRRPRPRHAEHLASSRSKRWRWASRRRSLGTRTALSRGVATRSVTTAAPSQKWYSASMRPCLCGVLALGRQAQMIETGDRRQVAPA